MTALDAPAAADALDRFEPFSPLHLATLAVCVFGWVVLVARARAAAGTPRETRFRRRLAFATIAFNLGWTIYRLTPAYYDVDASLPLHACDFAWVLGAIAMLPRRRMGKTAGATPGANVESSDALSSVRQLAFFYGIGLAPLGVVTPVLTDGPADVDFWAFWLRHFLIPACALVDVFAFGLRPTLRGLAVSIVGTLVLLVPITAINLALDTSYFFTGKAAPENPTPIDLLGDWPLRLLWIGLIGIGWFALLFAVGRRSRRQPALPW